MIEILFSNDRFGINDANSVNSGKEYAFMRSFSLGMNVTF